jgi:hypothetical protein
VFQLSLLHSASSSLWSTLYVIPFVQPERAQIAAGELHYMFSYENWVHEAGFARLAISVVGLLILFNPFRRGERWAFIALLFLAAAYDVPVFLFGGVPNLGTWPVFRNWHLPQFKVQNLTWYFGLHSFSAPRYCLGSACRPRPFSAGKATEPS